MSEEPEPDDYWYPYGVERELELQKGWQLGQKALFAATRPTSLPQRLRARDLATEALRFLIPATVTTDEYFMANEAIISEFGRGLQFLKDIDASAYQLNSDYKMTLFSDSFNALNNLQYLDQRYFFNDIKDNYNPFTFHTPSSNPGSRRRRKQVKPDWRLWIGKEDEHGKAIYALKGNDGIKRHFNQDNVVVQRSANGNWYSADQSNPEDEVGPRWNGEQLYADPNLHWSYKLPTYNDKQRAAIDQWVMRRNEEAARRAQTQGAVSYSLLDLLNHQQQQAAAAAQQQAGPSGWQAGPSGWQAGPSWPPYTGQGRRRYKSRRVKIPRQRRKTNRKNRKNKTIRKK